MRPLKLLLDGFGPYAQAQTVDFNPDLGLFAITGPTGAGKSTLLDAITYALYKATPRIGATGLKDLKHPQAESARVELTFAVGEQLWRVVRVVGNAGSLIRTLGRSMRRKVWRAASSRAAGASRPNGEISTLTMPTPLVLAAS